PIMYIEDPYYEKDLEGWKNFNSKFGNKLLVSADDLVVTNPLFLKIAIEDKLANAVIVKPNQVGSLTETFEFIKMAQKAKMSIIVSHRSGDTEDTFIADLALAVGADFIKAGAPARGERVAKYNRLLDIYYQKNNF
ncbi:MAG TPA: phosphopyruvate hydratase, partial [Candidatus Saccharimonadales bacterium]|nr:phosphopyruvate hydratase [Candidatus Saccharimonadales bacterium]